jgi:SIR2-like domain
VVLTRRIVPHPTSVCRLRLAGEREHHDRTLFLHLRDAGASERLDSSRTRVASPSRRREGAARTTGVNVSPPGLRKGWRDLEPGRTRNNVAQRSLSHSGTYASLRLVKAEGDGHSIRHALQTLQQEHPALLDEVSHGDRVFWVGSGVSRLQVPDLVDLIRKVLAFLRDSIVAGDAQDPHLAVLQRIIANYPALPPLGQEPRDWVIPEDLEALRDSYSAILSQRVANQPSDYLLWTAVDVRETYGSPAIAPGPEHQLLAMLVSEGVLSEIVSTNWDGLIERAVADGEPTGVGPVLAVFMSSDDFRDSRGDVALYKVHGCAVRARASEAYREYLVAQTRDIAVWSRSQLFRSVRTKVETLAQTRRTLVLGLSIQDYDLLASVAGATDVQPWPWDPSKPAYIFAEPLLKDGHRDMLDVVYEGLPPAQRESVESRSLFGTYSGPLLGALVLGVICAKLQMATDRLDIAPTTEATSKVLREGLQHLMEATASAAGESLELLISLLHRGYSAIDQRFYEAATPPARDVFHPAYRGSVDDVAARQEVRHVQIPELASVLGLLGAGASRDFWRLGLPPADSDAQGSVVVWSRHPGRVSTVVLVRDAAAADRFKTTKSWRSGQESLVLVHASGDRPRERTRGPARRLGTRRAAQQLQREAWMTEVVSRATVTSDILDAFRAEVSI